MGAINFLLSTASLNHYGLARTFELAHRLGFDGIEVFVDQRADTRQAEHLQRLRDDYLLAIPAVHMPLGKLPYPAPAEAWAERLGRAVELARAVGARIVVAHPPGVKEPPLDLARYCGPGEPVICFETMPRKTRKFLGFTLRRDRRQYESPAEWASFPTLAFDTCHVGSWGADLVETFTRLDRRVTHIHISNRASGQLHLPPRDGDLPLEAFLEAITPRYRGHITLELTPSTSGGYDPNAVLATLAESLQFCRNTVMRTFAHLKRSGRR